MSYDTDVLGAAPGSFQLGAQYDYKLGKVKPTQDTEKGDNINGPVSRSKDDSFEIISPGQTLTAIAKIHSDIIPSDHANASASVSCPS